MQTHVQKWGNSLGLRIPAHLSKQMSLEAGSEVSIVLEGDALIIKAKRDTLELLLAQITPDNCHHEQFEDDEYKGNETW